MCMYVQHMCACCPWWSGSDLLKLELYMVVSQCASVGNWNWVLWRNIKCSGPLGYLSSPQNLIFNVLIEKINDRKEKAAS